MRKELIFLSILLMTVSVTSFCVASSDVKSCLVDDPDWCCDDEGWIIDYKTEYCCPKDAPFYNEKDEYCYGGRLATSDNYLTRLSECEYLWNPITSKWSREKSCSGFNYLSCSVNNFIGSWDSQGKLVGKCGYVCRDGQIKCDIEFPPFKITGDVLECMNNKWVNTGRTLGKCNYDCDEDSACENNGFTEEIVCDGELENSVSNYSKGKCEENRCTQVEEIRVVEDCKDGCSDGVCLPETFTYVSPLVYVIPIIMISSVALIIWQLRKKPKRKK